MWGGGGGGGGGAGGGGEADQVDGEAVSECAGKAAHCKELSPTQHNRGETVP